MRLIPLAGPLAGKRAELSGLARYGDQVVLLPQYPARFEDSIFVLSAGDIAAALRTPKAAPLTPQALAFDDGGLSRSIARFQGFEAIAFAGDRAYLTFEAGTPRATQGYVVMGQLAPDGSQLRLDPGHTAALAGADWIEQPGRRSADGVAGRPRAHLV